MAENKWKSFSGENCYFNPYYCIWTDFKGDTEKFWAVGKMQVDEIFSEVKDLLANNEITIEIGCGIGRLLIPMCHYFKRCIGIDISKGMLDLLKKFSNEFGLEGKIETYLPSENWYRFRADFIFSLWVFQHIEIFHIIEDYIKKISESLNSGGLAYLQFDTRPKTLLYHIKNRLPDILLPKQWQREFRRIRRRPTAIMELFESYGLSILKEINPDTENHIFILMKGK